MLLRVACENRLPNEQVVGRSGYLFRKLFRLGLETLQLSAAGYKPHSMRRGGATHHFHRSGSLDRTAVRGRWRHVETARIYIDEAARSLAEFALPPAAPRLVDQHFQIFLRLFS